MAVFANGPMREPTCTPEHHVGDDDGGRCSACNERLAPRDLLRVGVLLMMLSVLAVLAVLALVVRWAIG
jgi:hypothetical protein